MDFSIEIGLTTAILTFIGWAWACYGGLGGNSWPERRRSQTAEPVSLSIAAKREHLRTH